MSHFLIFKHPAFPTMSAASEEYKDVLTRKGESTNDAPNAAVDVIPAALHLSDFAFPGSRD